MRLKRAVRPRSRAGAGGVRFAHECLGRLARILVESGHSPQRLSREFLDICKRLKEPKEPWDPTRLTHVADLPHIITHWHTDPLYVDRRGMPIPLPLHGPGRSLAALIERVLPGKAPAVVARSLVRLKGVRRRKGLYEPTERYLAYSKGSARAHALNALLGMLRTVEHNVSGKGAFRIFERAAMNPSFPVRAVAAFNRRLEARAMKFLLPVDRDMRRQEAAPDHGPRTRLGVGVFVFESPARGEAGGLRKRGRDRVGRRVPRRRVGRSRGGR